ncbi:hypothetical protein FI667_g5540, partial [Globisporangium splendens]
MADVELGNAAPAPSAAAEKDAAPFVSGSISLPSAEENTLDEPVSATIHAEYDSAIAAVRDGVHWRVCGDLGRRSHCHHQRTAVGEHHLIFPERVCVGVLRVPVEHRDAALHGAGCRGLPHCAAHADRRHWLCLVHASVGGVHVEARAAKAQGAHGLPSASFLFVH